MFVIRAKARWKQNAERGGRTGKREAIAGNQDTGKARKMKGKLNDKDARCPFFCAHTKNSVICEGVIPDSSARLNFDSAKAKNIQYEVFCCGKYENCEMYRAIQENYEE